MSIRDYLELCLLRFAQKARDTEGTIRDIAELFNDADKKELKEFYEEQLN
jgi:hypothetical protein